MTNLDERTKVPLLWVVSAMGVVIGISFSVAFWARSVDDRLARIEEFLNIKANNAGIELVKPVFAKERK